MRSYRTRRGLLADVRECTTDAQRAALVKVMGLTGKMNIWVNTHYPPVWVHGQLYVEVWEKQPKYTSVIGYIPIKEKGWRGMDSQGWEPVGPFLDKEDIPPEEMDPDVQVWRPARGRRF